MKSDNDPPKVRPAETKAPTTPATQNPTETCLTPNPPSARPRLTLGLKTFQDPALLELEACCIEWWKRFIRKDRPCWLTLCGRSHTGKTFCGDRLWELAERFNRTKLPPEKELYFPRKIWWPDFINKLRTGDWYDVLEDTGKWPLLYVDEIGANRDASGYVADQLYTLLAQREKKWTIITTNLTVEKLTEMDERIISRCYGYDGIVCEVNTIPYSERPKRS